LLDHRLRQMSWPMIERYRDCIAAQLRAGVTAATIHQRLRDLHGLPASVASLPLGGPDLGTCLIAIPGELPDRRQDDGRACGNEGEYQQQRQHDHELPAAAPVTPDAGEQEVAGRAAECDAVRRQGLAPWTRSTSR
jgi:hypothetical protein